MEEVGHILLNFGVILGAGLFAQLVATFLRIPEMVVLVAAGALATTAGYVARRLGLIEEPAPNAVT